MVLIQDVIDVWSSLTSVDLELLVALRDTAENQLAAALEAELALIVGLVETGAMIPEITV